MTDLLFALGGVLLILGISEVLWRSKVVRGEYARKFVHISTGSYVAFWPWFMSWRLIQVISLAFLFGVIISKSFNIFHAIHDVKRKTHGEELFAIGIFTSSMLTREPWMFALAVLTMTLADGLAAVIGTAYGKQDRYKLFGATKSWTGNLTFFITALLLFMGLSRSGAYGDSRQLVLYSAVPISLLLTVLEAVSVKGSDNITIPVAALLILKILT